MDAAWLVTGRVLVLAERVRVGRAELMIGAGAVLLIGSVRFLRRTS